MASMRPTRRTVMLASLTASLVCGCRSGPDAELIERELRWQENQIYALEDYLMEYQAKVRRLRDENTVLADSLSECQQTSAADPARRSTESSRSQQERLPGPPVTEDPDSRPDRPPTRTPEDEIPRPTTNPVGPPVVPSQPDSERQNIPDIPLPEVPPEQEESPSTWIGPPPGDLVKDDLPWIEAGENEAADQPSAELLAEVELSLPKENEPSSFKQWISGGLAPEEGTALDDSPDGDLGPANETQEPRLLPRIDESKHILAVDDDQLHVPSASRPRPAGYLVETNVSSGDATKVLLEADLAQTSGEHTLLLTLTPLTDDEEPTRFEGAASIMLRDPADRSPEGGIARWDYHADEIQERWSETSSGDALKFTLPLAEPLPTDQPVAVWVRLQPTDDRGEKILDHLTLRLQGSRRQTAPVDLDQGEWAVALPGKPALVDDTKPAIRSAWRASGTSPVRIAK